MNLHRTSSSEGLKKEESQRFKQAVWDHYKANRRDMPWRDAREPYRIFVSEVMLQQTQVSRVVPKYREFLSKFPTFKALADAPTKDVLVAWKGLGYNRRALNLKRAAEMIVKEHKGKLPKEAEALKRLPGIGPNTAGSLLAFAHNLPVPFIETNIRSVFIHVFFRDRAGIHDKEIMPLIEDTLDRENPREWYYALMDYGAMLKRDANPNLRSRHYARQSPFEGSRRQKRSRLLALALEKGKCAAAGAAKATGIELGEARAILDELVREGFLIKKGAAYIPA